MKAFTKKLRTYMSLFAMPIVITLIFLTFLSVSAISMGRASGADPEPAPPAPSISGDDAAVTPPPIVESPPPSAEIPPEPSEIVTKPQGFTGFSYNGAIPESAAVDDEWFSDAVFIGDSRTDGFRLHSGLVCSHIYGEKSISVFNVYTESTIRLDDGSFGTLLDALAQRQYKKVYIMLGINELGYSAEEFRAKYDELMDRVVELQPDADIYMQAVIPVTESKSASDSTYNNGRIQAFNEAIASICEERDFHYVDTYTAFADEAGALPEELSWDGVHFTSDGYVQWLQYLKTHTLTES